MTKAEQYLKANEEEELHSVDVTIAIKWLVESVKQINERLDKLEQRVKALDNMLFDTLTEEIH